MAKLPDAQRNKLRDGLKAKGPLNIIGGVAKVIVCAALELLDSVLKGLDTSGWTQDEKDWLTGLEQAIEDAEKILGCSS
jgi:hypothetical protein